MTLTYCVAGLAIVIGHLHSHPFWLACGAVQDSPWMVAAGSKSKMVYLRNWALPLPSVCLAQSSWGPAEQRTVNGWNGTCRPRGALASALALSTEAPNCTIHLVVGTYSASILATSGTRHSDHSGSGVSVNPYNNGDAEQANVDLK